VASLGTTPLFMRLGCTEEVGVGTVEIELTSDGETYTATMPGLAKLLRAAADALDATAQEVPDAPAEG
jgi:hypothetical protein